MSSTLFVEDGKLKSIFGLILVLAVCAGCGPDMQKAVGKVAVDGVPVKDGAVTFYPVGGGRPASASVRPDGTFTLSYEKVDDGLPPGDYKVTIVADIWKETNKKELEAMKAAAAKQGAIEDSSMSAAGQLIHVIPTEYNTIETTPLKESVKKSAKPVEFNYDIPTKKKN